MPLLIRSFLPTSEKLGRILPCLLPEASVENPKQSRSCTVPHDSRSPSGAAADTFPTFIGKKLRIHTGANTRQIQCINYLKATGLHVCPLLDFGKPSQAIEREAYGRRTARTQSVCICVHHLPSSAVDSLFLAVPCHKLATRTDAGHDGRRPSRDRSMHNRSESLCNGTRSERNADHRPPRMTDRAARDLWQTHSTDLQSATDMT